ncbi:S-layer homology domain-containing protein [bacterium]|nr:S-layer homology domain-containing protein [bacterium]
MRKLLAGLMAISFMTMNAVPALAAARSVVDVSKTYWAQAEIADVVSKNIMTIDEAGYFYPEETVSRVEFVKALLKVLSNDNLDVKIQNIFSDVASSDPDYADILRSQQLGLVYGYPNGTFQPSRVMLRDEAQSVVSHITKDAVTDTSILNYFEDADKVPSWATVPYAKSLAYGIYVNYPNAKELRPTDALTRAEAAVILARLSEKIGLVKDEFVGAERVLAVEHLDVKRNAPNNEVKVTNTRNIIAEGNVLEVAFSDRFKSEAAQAGDVVTFTTPVDISTEEGTLLIPAGSVFTGKVLDVTAPKIFNKNARVYVQITEVCLPSGQKVELNAKPFYKNYELKEGPWMTAGKLLAYTAGGTAVGTGAGVGFGFIPDPNRIGRGIAIGTPVGAAVGLITGLVTPGLNYHAKAGEEIFVILLDDASIMK